MKTKSKNQSSGRPTKYSPAVVKKICGMISRGLNYNLAAEAVGIHRDTFNDWQHTKSDFSDALKRAKAEGIDRRLKRIEQAGKKGNWQADAWWLERICREQFARNLPNAPLPNGDDGKAIYILMPQTTPPRPPPISKDGKLMG